MARLVAGEDAALNRLMERHGARVFGFLLRSLQSEEDADDLAQECFVRVYQNRERFDPRQKFTTWLYAIAANLVRDRFRWRARHAETSLESEPGDDSPGWKDSLPHPGQGPDELLQRQERAALVRAAVSRLPGELREALILSVYEGLPHAEVGAVLSCTAKAVETRLYRARNLLRDQLSELLA
ncbi:sigma-70 family RNA polymerase sigma factor [bacterium]|nr:sigma-70 family RNA polymerase sigma factor [bacterium]